MNVTLIQPPFKGVAAKQPPLGLAYIAAILLQKGAKVTIIDANVEALSLQQTVERVLAAHPNLVGVTVTTPLLNSALDIIRSIRKQAGVSIIVGGPHATIRPEDMLGPDGAQIAVCGEGEATAQELFDYYSGLRPMESIAGICYQSEGGIVRTEARPLLSQLDELPLPAWQLFPIHRYRSEVRKNKFSLPIMTTRGCPFGCIFCYKGVFGSQYRLRSPEGVVAEWEYLVRKLGVEEIAILDDNFSLIPRRVMEICDRVIDRSLVVPWTTPNGIRVYPVSLELFQKMKQAGCYRVYFGVESGDQMVLNAIKKRLTLSQVRTAFKYAKKARLETGAFFMIGNLPETAETMDATIKLAVELDPDYAQFTIATPYPGTEMYEILSRDREGKLLFDSWAELSSYDGATFSYKELTPELINQKYRQAFRAFYFRPRFMLRHLLKLRTGRDFINLLQGAKEVLKLSLRRRG